MGKLQHLYDIFVRSLKTALEVYVAFIAAGGFNVIHVSGAVEAKLSSLAFLVTAVLNSALKVHSAITSQQSTPPVAVPVSEPSPVVTG